VKNIGSQPTRTAFRSPWQNGVAERRVGSCRRDLPDHGVIRKERHLKRPRSAYLAYHDEDRTHLGLAKGTPAGRPTAVRSGTEARFNPCRDSAACTIGMQRQRRVKSCCFFRRPDAFSCNPAEARFRISARIFVGRRISLQSQAEEVAPSSAKSLVMEGTTIWRTTTGRKCRRRREDRVGRQSVVSSAS
jgi:hypothetical protein